MFRMWRRANGCWWSLVAGRDAEIGALGTRAVMPWTSYTERAEAVSDAWRGCWQWERKQRAAERRVEGRCKVALAASQRAYQQSLAWVQDRPRARLEFKARQAAIRLRRDKALCNIGASCTVAMARAYDAYVGAVAVRALAERLTEAGHEAKP